MTPYSPLKFEQHLYLRQPGYGTSYVVGKYLIERLMAESAEQLEKEGKEFVMEEFFREFNGVGCVSVMLASKRTIEEAVL